jgi:transcriptional regulator
VKDIKFTNVTTPAPDVVFVPLFQDQNLGARSGSAKPQVRSRMAPQDVAALVRARIRAQSLPVVVESAQTLEDAIGASMLNDRLRMQASSLFGAIALLLITAGIYGLMAYSVARRTREIGIRMAIGSAPAAIVRLVLIGILIGIPGAVAVMKAVGGMLFGLPPISGSGAGAARGIGVAMETPSLDLVRGTLDLLILKTLTWRPQHGYAIASAIKQATEGALLGEEGALYPALYRMEAKGWIEAEWGLSSNNRRAKYYSLTSEGRQRFRSEEKTWNSYAAAVGKLLSTTRVQTDWA